MERVGDMIVASRRGDLVVVKRLLSKGTAFVGFVNACSNGQLEVVKYLVEEYGIDIDIHEGQGLYSACSFGCYEVVKYLVSRGAEVFLRDGECLEVVFLSFGIVSVGRIR